MTVADIVAGQRQKWSLVQKLSEGDAGEVYLVESLMERKTAILKRPYRSTFTSDLLRRASQIRTEGRILKVLEGVLRTVQLTTPIQIPALLDQSQDGSEFGERFFIVVEKAAGFDLSSLARTARFGRIEEAGGSTDRLDYHLFLERLAARGEIPELVLLRALAGVIELFEQVHFAEITSDNEPQHGVIWNDVKPEHLYWDPARGCLTVIDWGNGQFLEADGAAQNRRFSRSDDYSQFLQEMGNFLADSSPGLYERLEWPAEFSRTDAYASDLKPLQERLVRLLEAALVELRDARRREGDLLGTSAPGEQHIRELENIQRYILDCGELPDIRTVEHLYSRYAARLAGDEDLEGLRWVCAEAARLPAASSEKWFLFGRIVDLATEAEENERRIFFRALHAGTVADWPTMLWELLTTIPQEPFPDWWDEVSQLIRHLHLQIKPGELTPYVVVSRLYFTLQAAVLRMETGQEPETVLRILEGEVVRKWKRLEADPPNSGIDYADIEGLVDGIEALLPGTKDSLEKVLSQPKAQARIVIDAWQRKEFETARRGLRNLLLWDPHRRRVLLADRAVQSAPRLLLRVRQGAESGENFHDFLMEVELAARELRNQVGRAGWLDAILDTFRQLRTGARPIDLLMIRPELLNDIPWLNEYRSRETISLPRGRDLTLERDGADPVRAIGLTGVREGSLGSQGELLLGEPLDTWLPEARGSSARVFSGRLGGESGQAKAVAIKIMRPDQASYALPLYREEAQILTILRDVPGVIRLLECGFIRLKKGEELPGDEQQVSISGLRGSVARYGVNNVQNFLASLEDQVVAGWLPYLALPLCQHVYNLMAFCDAGRTRGQFLPVRECLLLAIQICDILQVAHDRNIVYRDHKILHFYWDPDVHGVTTIDWNIAKRHPQGLGVADKKFDLVQFGARALHHILTGRAAPGALPLGPNRPEEIEQASHTYRAQWTYDDERLPNRIKEILEQTLSEGYSQVKDLRKDLVEVFEQLPVISVE
jgi:serine/threonine protein kinase